LSNPWYDFFLLYDWLPFLWIPLKLSGFFIGHARSSANKDNTRVVTLFDLNESEYKYICVSTDETLNSEISKLSFRMGADLIMLGFDEMEDYVRSETIIPLNGLFSTF
jgi:hypothetical protein